MLPADIIVAHYNEIALKLGHRRMFVGRLVDNVRSILADLGPKEVRSQAGRVLVVLGGASEAGVIERLSHIPGIANFVPAQTVPRKIEALEAAVEKLLESWTPTGSFAVDVRRADKRFPMTSPEIGARLGAVICERTGAPVNLRQPDSRVSVIVVDDEIYLGVSRLPGAGGLPVPTGGKVALLLSGGIDSPVAGLRMMRRGCRLDAIHFHAVPYQSSASQDKARQLASILARGQGHVRLTMVAFGDVQAEIVRFVPRPLRVVLYRRMMMRIAGKLAHYAGATALVTGESLGQVASQTLANMAVIEAASPMPVLRPLVGMEKLEISRYADRQGTFEISIIPDEDCCSLFVPKHPATAARPGEVLAAESLIDVERLTEETVAGAEQVVIKPSWEGEIEARVRLV